MRRNYREGSELFNQKERSGRGSHDSRSYLPASKSGRGGDGEIASGDRDRVVASPSGPADAGASGIGAAAVDVSTGGRNKGSGIGGTAGGRKNDSSIGGTAGGRENGRLRDVRRHRGHTGLVNVRRHSRYTGRWPGTGSCVCEIRGHSNR